MRLTTQMIAEIENIRNRVDHINQFIEEEILEPEDDIAVLNVIQTNPGFIAELKPYKVRLENILCETDIKEQVHSYYSPSYNHPIGFSS